MVRLFAAIWITAMLAASSFASLILHIDQPLRDAELGEYLLYTGSITYTGENEVEIYGVGFHAPDGFLSDFQGHLNFDSMTPGSTYTGELFSVRIDDRTTYETHTASVNLVGHDKISNEIVSDSKLITVNFVPEPATMLALIPAIGLLLRRRQRGNGCNPVDKMGTI